ncbi:MAG: TetR/AcrR family transcriptional regulator [Ilumatobacteraceae bacterium]
MESAMGLFAHHAPEDVTVADIAAASDMTAAAVYYHFASKEHVLLEGLQIFTSRFLLAIRDLSRDSGDGDWPRRFVTELLDWLEQDRPPAIVYFTHSAGVDASIEALRRETRIQQVVIVARAIRARHRTSRTNVVPDVAAIGLVSLIENAASSWLTQDSVFLGLGRRRFVDETATLAARIVEPADAPRSGTDG